MLTAGSAGDALRILREVLPAIVVSELTLADGTALRLMSELRALAGRTVPPVIGLREGGPESGGADEPSAAFTITLGKPVEPFDLCEVVAGVLGDAPRLAGPMPDGEGRH